MPTEQTVVTLQ